jgi:hypothetical protein
VTTQTNDCAFDRHMRGESQTRSRVTRDFAARTRSMLLVGIRPKAGEIFRQGRDIGAQTEQIFRNLEASLEADGANSST